MDTRRIARAGALASTIAIPTLIAACQDSARPDNPFAVEIQAAKGGNGGGGPPEKPAVLVELTGAMNTPSPQDGGIGEESKNRLEINGRKTSDCVVSTDPDCFWTDIVIGAGVDDGQGTTGLAACQPYSGTGPAEAQLLFDALTDAAQARSKFEADIDARHGDGLWRTFWFEDGNPARFNIIHSLDSATETATDVWLVENGWVTATHSGYRIDCPWIGSITLSFDRL